MNTHVAQLKKIFAAGAFSLATGPGAFAGLFGDWCAHNSRPWYDPSCEPTWGYHETNWRRYPHAGMYGQGSLCPDGTCQPSMTNSLIQGQPVAPPMNFQSQPMPTYSSGPVVTQPQIQTLQIPQNGVQEFTPQGAMPSPFEAPDAAIPNATPDQILPPLNGGQNMNMHSNPPVNGGSAPAMNEVPLPLPATNGMSQPNSDPNGLPPLPGQTMYYQSPLQQQPQYFPGMPNQVPAVPNRIPANAVSAQMQSGIPVHTSTYSQPQPMPIQQFASQPVQYMPQGMPDVSPQMQGQQIQLPSPEITTPTPSRNPLSAIGRLFRRSK